MAPRGSRGRGDRGRGLHNRGGGGSRGGRGRGDNMVLPANTAQSGAVTSGSDDCGMCKLLVGEDGVGCDHCDRWFHPSAMCMGLPSDLVASIASYGGDGITYSCNDCRLATDYSDNVSSAVTKQLFETVKNLCNAVTILTRDVQQLLNRPPAQQTQGPMNNEHLRVCVRDEIREMDERKKRKSTVIIRGVNVDSANAIKEAFHPISEFVLGHRVELLDITCVSSAKKIYRARITDDSIRKSLLDNSKKLKTNSAYANIYINRDLTYLQRNELFKRRQERRNGSSTEGNSQEPSALAGNSGNLNA